MRIFTKRGACGLRAGLPRNIMGFQQYGKFFGWFILDYVLIVCLLYFFGFLYNLSNHFSQP